MLKINKRKSARKSDNAHIDDAPYVVRAIAERFHLSIATARTVAELANLGASNDRTPSSGGRS
jgi:hypothetical protein